MRYYLRRSGKNIGVFTEKTLRSAIGQKKIKTSDEISVSKTSGFVPIGTVHKLAIRGKWQGAAEWRISTPTGEIEGGPFSAGEVQVFASGEIGTCVKHVDSNKDWVAVEDLADTYPDLHSFLNEQNARPAHEQLIERKSPGSVSHEHQGQPSRSQLIERKGNRPQEEKDSEQPQTLALDDAEGDEEGDEEELGFIGNAVVGFLVVMLFVGVPWGIWELGVAAWNSSSFWNVAMYGGIACLGVASLAVLFYQPKLGFTLLVTIPCLLVVGKFTIVIMDLLGFMGFDPSQMTWTEISHYLFFAGMICIASCFSWVGALIVIISKLIGDETPILMLVLIGAFGCLLCLLGLPVMLWNALTFSV